MVGPGVVGRQRRGRCPQASCRVPADAGDGDRGAERIGREHSITTLKHRVRQIRPEYAVSILLTGSSINRVAIAQCDLWFPEPKIPVGHGQNLILPVLVITLGSSRFLSAMMLPSRQAGDLLAGIWQLIQALGAVPRTLIWDRESAIGGTGVATVPRLYSLAPWPPGSSWRQLENPSSRGSASATMASSRPRFCPAGASTCWLI